MQNYFTRHLLISCLSLFLFSSIAPLYAFEKTGTTAAPFLQINTGARIPSMGGAGVANSVGSDAISLNPAAAWTENPLSVSMSYTDWFAELRHQSISLVSRYSHNLQFGLQFVSFSGESFEQTTVAQQNGNGIEVEYGDYVIGLSGISRLTDRFTFGGSVKYISQNLFNESASTFAVDVGTHLTTSFPGLSIGMSMTNLGGEMQLDGIDLYTESSQNIKYETSTWSLPLTFQIGISQKLISPENGYIHSDFNSLLISADAKHLNEGITSGHLGIEYGYGETIFLRSGKILNHDTQDWSFGLGVNLKLRKYIVRADLAYADFGELDSVKRVGFTVIKN